MRGPRRIDPSAAGSPKGRSAALVLGALGVIPFFVTGAAIWAGPARLGAAAFYAPIALLAYAATIAAFLGGVRWGVALARVGGPDPRVLAASTVPQLLAWALIFAPIATELRFAGLLLLFIAQALIDVGAETLPLWYRRLRLPLTVAACAALASGLVWSLELHRRT